MTRRQFERVVERALALLPAKIRRALDNLAVIVEDHPGPEELAELGLGPGDYLYGLFRGIPLTEQSFFSPGGNLPHQIVIFQGELEQAYLGRRELTRQIVLTLIHEVGHYLGLDEEELRRLEVEASRPRRRV